jgi:magnesium-transporting ATPase (P-type)
MKFSEYTAKSNEEVFNVFQSSEKGISEKEAKKRLEAHGFNEIKTKEPGLFDIFLRQFKTPFVYLLFIAAIVAFLISEEIDGIVILSFVFINVILGFFQEGRAHRAVLLLKRYFPSKTRIIREGTEKMINKIFLVPGDVVLLEQGDIAPADLRIFKEESLLVDETILTGESVPVPKTCQSLSKEAKEIFEAKNIVFAGTSIISGEVIGMVISTGRETVLGEVTKLLSTIKKESF